MGKREEKITRAAHIKKHTRGTSNEISFSVLDAAKNALDGDADTGKNHVTFFGRIALFTLPGRRKKPAGTPTKERGLPLSTGDFVSVEDSGPVTKLGSMPADVSTKSSVGLARRPSSAPVDLVPAKPKRSPEEEIARRKARRRLSKVLAVSIIVVVSTGLLVAGGGYLYHDYQKQQNRVAVLDDALNLVKETDETFMELQEVVSNPFEDGRNEERASIRDHLSSVDENLQRADDLARTVSVELNNSRDKEAANQTVVTIAARRAIIVQAQLLMNAADEAAAAYDQVEAAWKLVMQADDLTREAAQLIADTTVDNVEASKVKTNEALGVFDDALTGFIEVQAAYNLADFSPFVEYIQKRQESLEYAILSDNALLEKNKEEATAQNNAYNIADAEAATLAKALPTDPASLVDEAYEVATADAAKAYSTARLQASTADAFITDYLGAGSK